MNWTSTSPLRAGQVIEISFATFTPRISIRSEHELTVEVIAAHFTQKRRGRLRYHRRPKSREETLREGSDSGMGLGVATA